MRSSRPPPVPPAPRPDTSIGPYRLANRIAVGGMAEVFRALDQPPAGAPRAVVIKRMLPTLALEDECRRMFEDEARLGLRIHHDNVVDVLATGEDGSIPYIVLEYVFGVDLWRLTRWLTQNGTTLRLPVAMYVVTEMLAGLAAVHSVTGDDGRPLGIVHRDVSPSNVFLSVHGDVKLGDLGIAGAAMRETHPTAPRNTRAKGKLGYLAPEQVAGLSSDQRADVFAAAVIASELIMGRPLFTGGGEIGILLAIRDGDIKPFREVAHELDPELGLALLGALERSPEVRTETAAELRERLLRFSAQEEVEEIRRELGEQVARVLSETDDEGPSHRRALAKTVEGMDIFDAATPSMTIDGRVRLPSDAGEVLMVSDPSEVPQEAYRVHTSSGAELGPYTYASLIGTIATGKVGPQDRIRVGDETPKPIFQMPELMRHMPPSSRTPTLRRRTRMVETNELHDLTRGGMVRVLGRALVDRDSGLLLCEHDEVRREVYLQDGVPVYVASNMARDLLGEYLVSQGVIDRSELDMALAVMPRFEGRLGETLSALGLVEPVHLVRHIAAQVRARLLDTFTWPAGQAAFYAGVEAPEARAPLELDAWELLDAGITLRFGRGLEERRWAQRGGEDMLVASPLAEDLLSQPLPWHVEMALRALEQPRSLRHMEAKLDDGDMHAAASRGRRLLTLLLEIDAVRWVG